MLESSCSKLKLTHFAFSDKIDHPFRLQQSFFLLATHLPLYFTQRCLATWVIFFLAKPFLLITYILLTKRFVTAGELSPSKRAVSADLEQGNLMIFMNYISFLCGQSRIILEWSEIQICSKTWSVTGVTVSGRDDMQFQHQFAAYCMQAIAIQGNTYEAVICSG